MSRLPASKIALLRQTLDDSRTLTRVANDLANEAAYMLDDEYDDVIDLIDDYTANNAEMTFDEFCKKAGVVQIAEPQP